MTLHPLHSPESYTEHQTSSILYTAICPLCSPLPPAQPHIIHALSPPSSPAVHHTSSYRLHPPYRACRPCADPSELVLTLQSLSCNHPLYTPGCPCLPSLVPVIPRPGVPIPNPFPTVWLQLWLPDDHPRQVSDLRQHRPLQGQCGRWGVEPFPRKTPQPSWGSPPWLHPYSTGCQHLSPLPKSAQRVLTSSLSWHPRATWWPSSTSTRSASS